MRASRLLLPIALLLLIVGFRSTASAQTENTALEESTTDCWHDIVPAAALSNQPRPVFCDLTISALDTATIQDARWVDEFDHGQSFADFTHTNYLVFEAVDGVDSSSHWRHANHWMVDVAPGTRSNWQSSTGGTVMRPNQPFWQVNNKIVVEADFAAGHQDYRDLQGWGELIVTTAPAPTGYRQDGFYGYEFFPGNYTLGCRLQADRHTICALMDNTERGATNGGRIWEMSFFQEVGHRRNVGGYPTAENDAFWRICAAEGDGDAGCRDRFRMELTRDTIKLFVNGYEWFSQEGIPALPDELFNGTFYTYFASMVGEPKAQVMRFHWDRLAVNPLTGPTMAANFTPPPSEEEQAQGDALALRSLCLSGLCP